MTRGNKRWLLILGLALAATAAARQFAIGSWRVPEARKQIAESVARRPTHYTELYFTEASKLPKILLPGANPFSFTVANHEGTTVDYPYEVTAQSADHAQIVAEGTVTVASGNVAETPVSFTPDQPATSYVVTVQLVGRAEVIHFLCQS